MSIKQIQEEFLELERETDALFQMVDEHNKKVEKMIEDKPKVLEELRKRIHDDFQSDLDKIDRR